MRGWYGFGFLNENVKATEIPTADFENFSYSRPVSNPDPIHFFSYCIERFPRQVTIILTRVWAPTENSWLGTDRENRWGIYPRRCLSIINVHHTSNEVGRSQVPNPIVQNSYVEKSNQRCFSASGTPMLLLRSINVSLRCWIILKNIQFRTQVYNLVTVLMNLFICKFQTRHSSGSPHWFGQAFTPSCCNPLIYPGLGPALPGILGVSTGIPWITRACGRLNPRF